MMYKNNEKQFHKLVLAEKVGVVSIRLQIPEVSKTSHSSQFPNKKPVERSARRFLKSKIITHTLARILYNAVGYFSNSSYISPCARQYYATTQCTSTIEVDKTGYRTSYCKQRTCKNCNRIRTAKLIEGYLPQLDNYIRQGKLYFVTLTKPTIHYTEAVRGMDTLFNYWQRLKRAIRNKKFIGIRKAETTISKNEQDHLHQHFHLLVEGKENANWIVKKWLKIVPGSNIKAQDIRKADRGSIREMFKYFTKVSLKIVGKWEKGLPTTYKEKRIWDAVFCSIKGRRVIQPFGGLRKIAEEFTDKELEAASFKKGQVNSTPGTYIYVAKEFNWVHTRDPNQKFVLEPISLPATFLEVVGVLPERDRPPKEYWQQIYLQLDDRLPKNETIVEALNIYIC